VYNFDHTSPVLEVRDILFFPADDTPDHNRGSNPTRVKRVRELIAHSRMASASSVLSYEGIRLFSFNVIK